MADRDGGREGKHPAPPCSTLILGVGNILLGDEGVGVRTVEAMREIKLPGHVEVVDGGTGGFELLDIMAGREKVIVIDAVKGGGEPGAVYRFSPDDIGTERQCLTSVHQLGLPEALATLKLTGCPPRDITIYGIEPKKIDWGLGLSGEVAAAVPRVIELIKGEL